MIIYENKTDLITRKILVHIARKGIYDLASFSKLAKSINIGRSLLYFYYKNENEIIDSAYKIFIYELDYHHAYVKQRQFNFNEYLDYLVDMKDLYFFLIECVKIRDSRKEFNAFVKYAFNTIDRYAFEEFTKKYELGYVETSRLEYMYHSLRSYWFENSGIHDDWCYEKVHQLRDDLDHFMIGLRNDLAITPS